MQNKLKKNTHNQVVSLPPSQAPIQKHALESIFAHLDLSELGHVSATCRSEQHAAYLAQKV